MYLTAKIFQVSVVVASLVSNITAQLCKSGKIMRIVTVTQSVKSSRCERDERL